MKKLIVTAAMWMGVSAANLNAASVNGAGLMGNLGDIVVSNESGLKFKVLVKNEEKKNATVTIKNEVGDVFYQYFLSKNEELKKVFDLSSLPDGKYTIEVMLGKEKQSKSFEIKSSTSRAIINE